MTLLCGEGKDIGYVFVPRLQNRNVLTNMYSCK